MFFKRSYEPEIMDDFSIKDNRIDKALNELKYINKFLGGITVSKKGFDIIGSSQPKRITTGNKNNSGEITYDSFSVLDIGAGASDNLISIAKKKNIAIHSVDKNPRACSYVKYNSHLEYVVCGDVFNLPYKKKFDVVHCSLFLHHFTEEEIKRIMVSLKCAASKGIIINDLRRSVFAYAGIKILTNIFSSSRMVKHDGPLSVKRGFVKKDIVSFLKQMDGVEYKIKRMWAFRWLVVVKFINNEVKD